MTPDRRSKILHELDLRNTQGLEVGPLSDPAVRKEDGSVLYVDHWATEDLRRHYGSLNVPESGIAETDIVWSGGPIAKVLPEKAFDYVVASHVIEHVPDPITWLRELTSALRPGGTVRLAIPDKRFCFDRLRSESRTSDLLAARFSRLTRPDIHQVVDSEFHHRSVELGTAWRESGDPIAPPSEADLDRAFEFAARAAEGEYVDVHCWTFTPTSFLSVMEQVTALGLIDLKCLHFWDTALGENEFFVVMAKGANEASACAESWRRASEMLQSEPVADAAALSAKVRWLVEEHRQTLDRARSELSRVRSESQARQDVIDELRRSTSWRLTAPLRALMATSKKLARSKARS